MKTTTSIKELQKVHNLLQSNYDTFTNEQVLHAAAIVAIRQGCNTEQDMFRVLYDECDMSLAATLNSMDTDELFEYAKLNK